MIDQFPQSDVPQELQQQDEQPRERVAVQAADEGPVVSPVPRFDERPVQGKVKHTILRQYAGAWAGIILNGARHDYALALRAGRHFAGTDLVYMDGFGGAGRYARDFDGSAGPIWGSPIIGVQALEAQAARASFPVRVTAYLTEENSTCYRELVRNLEAAGLRTPIVEVQRFTRTGLGQVNVLRGDFRDQIQDLMALLGPGHGADPFVLALIDPYGPTMRMDDVRALLGRQRTDGIVLFPYHDVEVRSGSAVKAQDERQRMDRQNLVVRTAHFGTETWIEIANRPGVTAEEREAAWAQLYGEQIRAADPALIVKNIPLRLGTIDRTAYHLFLVTRDASGAMKLNEVLREAEVNEDWILWQGLEARLQEEARALGQASLFGDEAPVTPPKAAKRAFPIEDVARELVARVGGRLTTLDGIYRAMADTLYTAGEIGKALRLLRDRGQAEYDSLTSRKAPVCVAAGAPARVLAPGTPAAAASSRARSPRGRGPDAG